RVCPGNASRSWRYPRRWTMTCQAPIIASALAHASAGRLNCRIVSTSAGSHERFLVMEVFGRYAGFTAMLPTMAGAANRCVIPEYKFDMEHLTELLCYDRAHHPSKYSVVIVSEGAMFEGGEMVFSDKTTDPFGHLKLGGMGDLVSAELKNRSAKYNKGKPIQTINQRLGYMVRGGDPDA